MSKRRCLTAGLALLLVLGFGCRRGSNPQVPDVDPAANSPAPGDLFLDVTAESGIDFTYRNGAEANHYAILESLGGGVALLDYDGDGLLDVFVTGGGYFDGPDKKEIRGHPCKLYHNLGNCKFQDVTDAVGLGNLRFYTHGCAVADYNNDGWPDLLITGWGRLALFQNVPSPDGQGRRFVETTQAAKLDDRLWSTSAAWGDLDGDGFPDLYVCHYIDWSFANHPFCTGYSAAVERDVCPPKQFKGLPHVLYRNNGDGTFSDVSREAGLRIGTDNDGKGLGVLLVDVDDDGKPDIYVANDTVDNFLYLNRSQPGRLAFVEEGVRRGVARDDRGEPNGSMGVDTADYEGTGRPALFVTNYENEVHALYRNLGQGRFLCVSAAAGISALGQTYVGFGTAFADFRNRGWEDLAIVNGHVIRHPRATALRQRPVLLQNQGTGRFTIVTPEGGCYFRADHIARGLAVGDLDNDGWPDLVVSHLNEPVAVLRNQAREVNQRYRWLGIELVRRDNRDAVGTKVVLDAGGRRQTRFVKGGGSYLSSSDRRILFGLGENGRVNKVTVTWPSGKKQDWTGQELPVDRYHKLREAEK